jgi:hypothetical protein
MMPAEKTGPKPGMVSRVWGIAYILSVMAGLSRFSWRSRKAICWKLKPRRRWMGC